MTIMEQPAPSPAPRLSLKLTVTFLAFLAVLPAIAFLASLNVMEGDEKTRVREWQVARSNAAVSVAAWFDRSYRDAVLAEVPSTPAASDLAVPDEQLRGGLQKDFSAAATSLGLTNASLFWNLGTQESPNLSLLGRVGTAPQIPDAELLSAFRGKVPIYGTKSAESHEQIIVQVSLPLQTAGEFRGVARLLLPAQDWTSRGIAVATGLGGWIEDVRDRMARDRTERALVARTETERAALKKALESPSELADWDGLRSRLEATVESLRGEHELSGLTLFRVVPEEGGGGPTLRSWLKSGVGPQNWSHVDQEARRSGTLVAPLEGANLTEIALPLVARVRRTDSTGIAHTVPEVVAVAHFYVPAPAPTGRVGRILLIVMIGVMALVLGFLFLYMNQAISQPIQRLIGAMTRGAEGELHPIAAGGASGEVAQLALIYNRMVQENQKLMNQIRGFNEELRNKVRLATSELEKRNEDLRNTNARLFQLQRELTDQQRLASLGQLAGSMAHELGTPLNAMSGHIELLLSDEGHLAPDVSKRLRLIGGQIERLSGIIQRTLHQLRVPAPHFVSVDLNHLVQGIVSLVTPSVSSRKVTIRTSLAPTLPRVQGDPEQLEQVVMNLVNNALDAMPGGGSLDLLTAAQEGQVCLQVRDSGAGISSEDQARIFDPFYTTKGPGKGTGLGLAICQDIVKAHHGTIDVQSEPGQGSWFTVRFPLEVGMAGSPAPAPIPAVKG